MWSWLKPAPTSVPLAWNIPAIVGKVPVTSRGCTFQSLHCETAHGTTIFQSGSRGQLLPAMSMAGDTVEVSLGLRVELLLLRNAWLRLRLADRSTCTPAERSRTMFSKAGRCAGSSFQHRSMRSRYPGAGSGGDPSSVVSHSAVPGMGGRTLNPAEVIWCSRA